VYAEALPIPGGAGGGNKSIATVVAGATLHSLHSPKGIVMSAKVLGTVGFIGLAIAAKVFFSTPHYRSMDKGTHQVPDGQAFIAEMNVFRPLKAKLTMTSEVPFAVFWLNPNDHAMIQSGNITDISCVDRMQQQSIGSESTTIVDQEFHLPKGRCFIYFEPLVPEDTEAAEGTDEEDAEAVAQVEPAPPGVSRSFTYEISEWR